VKNPYVLDRSPCGSSSGSGSAIAANLACVAVGTETDGSILCPSSSNCLVGIKTTLGLVSRDGVVPISHSQDTVGPMARTVTDAAILLSVLAGYDKNDPSMEKDSPYLEDYTQFLDPDGLRGARIGVARDEYFGKSPKVDQVAEAAIAKMREIGATLVDPANIPSAKKMADSKSEITVMLYEFKHDLNRYLSELEHSQVRSLRELIEFNNSHAETELPYFGQELFQKAEETTDLTDPKYLMALEENLRLSRKEGIDFVMDEHHLDALIAPTWSPAGTIDLIVGDHRIGGSSQPTALSGYPAITVPAGFVFGLPVGITFMGRAHSESTLIKLAYSFEQATKVRAPPKYLPQVP
jgi:amidase